ncbi:TniQ family protein [uncultured Shewanella sp.]|uniref:TniQ family protein n=1 Tax=uncultured Shewanella sp. TaxID=173975 RepID=UPI003704814E
MIQRKAVLANVHILPGEHALGPLARLFLYSSYRSLPDTVSTVTHDSGALTSGVIWRQSYSDIYKYWCSEISLDNFASKHSLFNFYLPFLPDKNVLCVERNQRLLAPSVRVVRYTNTWRYCVECAEADIAIHGFPYFHVGHQLPGITRCTEHKTLLRSGCLVCGNDWQKLGKLLAPPLNGFCGSCCSPIDTVQQFINEDVAWIQQMADRLLKGDFNHLTLTRLQAAYRQWLGIGPRQGVLNLKERVIVQEAQDHIDNAFDPRLYRLLFTNTDEGVNKKRSPVLSLYQAAFTQGKLISPIIHLILIRAMFGEIDNIPQL